MGDYNLFLAFDIALQFTINLDKFGNHVGVYPAGLTNFDLVTRQPRTLRTDEIQKWLPWFVAHGHGLGWNAKQSDVERIAREWRGLRTKLVGEG